MRSLTPACERGLQVILAQGGLEQGQVHRGRLTPSTINKNTAKRLVDAGLARWEQCPPRPTPRPPRRCHAQLRRWLDRQKHRTVPTLHATAAGCIFLSRSEPAGR